MCSIVVLLGFALPGLRVVFLRDVFDGEIFGIHIRLQHRLERCIHGTQRVPVDAVEVRVLFDFGCAMWSSSMSDAVGRITKEAADQAFRSRIKLLGKVIGNEQGLLPIDDLTVPVKGC